MTREEELCMMYDKHILARELIIAYDQIALLQEHITEELRRNNGLGK